ncbi:uncharacterized protein LOC117807978 [Notolabrus celidotus]|uniref:uncharacterized protein LOC117807978 n=1 Tax=Notolabrus celidotus TaxID=1203425 RepID=UPI0014908130|nr:uncharacterized protein LOC117807978 [Notolabrus celidotus]
MWQPVSSMILAGWVCACAAAAVTTDSELYKKVGDDVVLKPDPTSDPLLSITWRHGSNLAAVWDGPNSEGVDLYGQFEGRSNLNNVNGELTITGLTAGDTGLYTAEINNIRNKGVNLIVLSPVPKPTVSEICDTGGAVCSLTCDGDTTGAGTVTYKWNSVDSEKTKHITKDDSVGIGGFTCEMKNPVSSEISELTSNPFYIGDESTETKGGLNISKGLTVFLCLLSVVLLLCFIHRCKAGEWFFEKGSMPWQADFWRKQGLSRDAAESNGTSTNQDRGQAEGQTLMADKQPNSAE